MLEPIAALNDERSPTEFGDMLKPLFEAAEPLALALYDQRPFASYAELIDRAESLANHLPPAEQLKVLNAHPRIGQRADRLSAMSRREQSYHQESADVDAALAELNAAYEARFGFCFLVFVNQRPRSAILDVLRGRLRNTREQELQTALRDLFLIARDRLRVLQETSG